MLQKRYLVFMQIAAAFFLALLGLVASVLAAQAAPAAPTDVPVTQPDGTQLVLHIWGDEFSNGMETVDGYSVVKNPGGYWVYAARQADGKLGPALVNGKALVAGKDSPSGLEKNIRPERSARPQASASEALASGSMALNTHMIGTQPVLVLLVKFTDRANTYTPSAFQTRFFGPSGSVQAFYKAASLNQLNLVPAAENDSAAYGGVASDGVVGWIPLNYPHPNDTDMAPMIVKDALTAASNSGAVNFAAFDTNADSYISNSELHIVVIAAGYEQSYCGGYCAGPRIWAHRWTLNNGSAYSYDVLLNGKHLGQSQYNGGYLIFGEVMGLGGTSDHQSTMGVMAHETGHDLNWPDEYDANSGSTTDWEGTGDWSIMGGGSWNGIALDGDTPAMPDAFLRSYQGWITPTQAVNGNTYTLNYNYTDNTASVLRLGDNPNGVDWDFEVNSGTGEYWLVENRQKEGFDAALPNCGILVWHVNETRSYQNPYANDLPTTALIALEEADGLKSLQSPGNRGDAGDSYPGSKGKYSFSFYSTPNSTYQNGAPSAHNVWIGYPGTCAADMSVSYTFGEPVLDKYIRLPKMSNEKPIIPFNGRLTDNGVPLAGQSVTLRYTTNNYNYYLYNTVVSNADGSFTFPNTPEVDATNKKFIVGWSNKDNNSNRLKYFDCNWVSSDTPDYNCNMEVHNVTHLSPLDAATVDNPVVHLYNRRSFTSDWYEVVIRDTSNRFVCRSGEVEYKWIGVQVNWNGCGMQNNTLYYWGIGVITPEGLGESYYQRAIYFLGLTYSGPAGVEGSPAHPQSVIPLESLPQSFEEVTPRPE